MFSKLHRHLGTAGLVVAIVALVAALGGGAYAASGGGGKASTSAAGKQGPRGKTGKTGKTGPQGPVGPAGANGANGKDGAAGTAGTNGTTGKDGKSVVVAPETAGFNCTEGGVSVKVEGSATKEFICNGEKGQQGKEGSPWTAGGVLPTGKTETGTWASSGSAKETEPAVFEPKAIQAAVSLTLPLPEVPEAVFCGPKAAEKTACATTKSCPGLVEGVPKAENGPRICIYAATLAGASEPTVLDPTAQLVPGAAKSGAIIQLTCKGLSCTPYGTWAAIAK